MKESEERTLTIPLIPEDSIGFRIVKDREPVEGARVTLCTKGLIPVTFERTTDARGRALFSTYDLVADMIPPDTVKEIPWLFFANIPESDYAIWKDDVKFENEKLYTYTLKRYTKVPTFFIKIELRDIIGAEAFASIAAKIQEKALEWAGLEVVKVEGAGTRTVTIQFRPPWHSSPFVISWSAWWFCLSCLAIIYVLYMLKWSFGELAPVVTGLGIIAVIVIAAASLAKPAKKVAERVRERVGR